MELEYKKVERRQRFFFYYYFFPLSRLATNFQLILISHVDIVYFKPTPFLQRLCPPQSFNMCLYTSLLDFLQPVAQLQRERFV